MASGCLTLRVVSQPLVGRETTCSSGLLALSRKGIGICVGAAIGCALHETRDSTMCGLHEHLLERGHKLWYEENTVGNVLHLDHSHRLSHPMSEIITSHSMSLRGCTYEITAYSIAGHAPDALERHLIIIVTPSDIPMRML